jgi:hypothetical protein
MMGQKFSGDVSEELGITYQRVNKITKKVND